MTLWHWVRRYAPELEKRLRKSRSYTLQVAMPSGRCLHEGRFPTRPGQNGGGTEPVPEVSARAAFSDPLPRGVGGE